MHFDEIREPQPTSVCCIFGVVGRALSWDPTRPIASWEESEGGLDPTQNEFRPVDPDGNMAGQAGEAAVDANNWRDQGYYRGLALDNTAGNLGANANYFGQVARGAHSVSAEQLRQGLQQQLAAQQSMAAGARGGNQAMAALAAMGNMGRIGAGMAGQQALAGLQEREQAMRAQQQALMGQGQLYGQARGQDLGASTAARQNALAGYGDIERQRGSRFQVISGVPTQAERGIAAGMGVAQIIASRGMGGGYAPASAPKPTGSGFGGMPSGGGPFGL